MSWNNKDEIRTNVFDWAVLKSVTPLISKYARYCDVVYTILHNERYSLYPFTTLTNTRITTKVTDVTKNMIPT
jgi:hypothetical protein